MILGPKIAQKTTLFSNVVAPFSRPCPNIDFWTHLCRTLAPFWHPFGRLWLPFGSLWLPFGRLWLPLGSLCAPFGSLWATFWLQLAPFRRPSAHFWSPQGPIFSHLMFPGVILDQFLEFSTKSHEKSLFFQLFSQILRLQYLFSWTRSGNLPQAT